MAWKLVIDVYCCFHFPLSHMSLFCSIPTRPLLVGFGCRPSAASLVKWWIAASLGAIAPQHSGEKSGCTTTRLYSVHNYIWYFFQTRLIPWSAFHCQHPRVCCTAVPLQMQLCSLSLMQFQFECGALCSLRCIRSLEKWSTTTVAGRWTAPPIIIAISLHHQMEHIISSSWSLEMASQNKFAKMQRCISWVHFAKLNFRKPKSKSCWSWLPEIYISRPVVCKTVQRHRHSGNLKVFNSNTDTDQPTNWPV